MTLRSPGSRASQSWRAQMLVLDLLGGGDEWYSHRLPPDLAGGVLADGSPTYVFAAPALSDAHRSAMAELAGGEMLAVIAVEFGAHPGDLVRFSFALWQRRCLIEVRDASLWMLNGRAGAVDIDRHLTFHLDATGCSWTDTLPWTCDEDRHLGLKMADRLARKTIWQL